MGVEALCRATPHGSAVRRKKAQEELQRELRERRGDVRWGIPGGQRALGSSLAKGLRKQDLPAAAPLRSARGRQRPAPTGCAGFVRCRGPVPKSHPHHDDLPWDRGGEPVSESHVQFLDRHEQRQAECGDGQFGRTALGQCGQHSGQRLRTGGEQRAPS